LQHVWLIAAARPNFMKVAPLYRQLAAASDFTPLLVHTGQHYDANMSGAFFDDLGLPEPDHHLGIGSGTHAEQTAGVMVAFDRLLSQANAPDWLVVVGDVNPTAACALVATKRGVRTVHLEAGLRSRDRAMPEELNRLVTDTLSDVLWTPSPDADENLRSEGIPAGRITRVGNIMLDSFELLRARIEQADEVAALGLKNDRFGVVTLHRPSNVDGDAQLGRLVDALVQAQRRLPLVFPVHPRTAKRLAETGFDAKLSEAGIRLVEPLPYIRFMNLVTHCAAAITDSGGIQEETTYLGIPCLTLRDNTERPITITEGTNRLVDASNLVEALETALAAEWKPGRPDLWDGHTAERCVEDLRRRGSA
jgi:UDP-N-acetylglucosamine 2-epimerase (non-hydrolysing)